MERKERRPRDQVKEEIRGTMRTQRGREAMDKDQNSFKTETNEAYFGPAGPGGMRQPPPRVPHPTAPGAPGQPPAQQPPSTQPPASKPDCWPIPNPSSSLPPLPGTTTPGCYLSYRIS